MSDSARSLLDRTEANQRAIPLLAAPQAIAAGLASGLVIGTAATWWLGLVVGVLLAAAILLVLPRSVSTGVARLLPSRPAPEGEFPRYHNLVEGLAASTGAEAPELRVLDEPRPNLAVYGPPDAGVIVATTGLLNELDRVELEGVLAEALVRLRSHDADLGAHAAAFVCGPLVRNGPRRAGRPMAVVTPFAAFRARRLRRLLGAQREFLADLAAVDVTRYPPGLGAALEKMEASGTGVECATWGTAHLWLADPLMAPADGDATAVRLNEMFRLPIPIEQRASLMAEL